MITHRYFDSVTEALLEMTKEQQIQSSIYIFEDCISTFKNKFSSRHLNIKHILKEIKTLLLTNNKLDINILDKIIDIPITQSGIPPDNDQTINYIDDLWINFYQQINSTQDEQCNSINIYFIACRLFYSINKNIKNKVEEYFAFVSSLFSTNDLKDNFFKGLDFNKLDDLCVFFDYLNDNYPNHELLIQSLKNDKVLINLPNRVIFQGKNNFELANNILNSYHKWIPEFLKRIYL